MDPKIKAAAEKAMQLCSRKEYGSKEMFDKIVSWGYTAEEARPVIDLLTAQKFLDDRRFANAFVKDKLRFNKWGRVKITYMLRMQGIDENVIREALAEIDEEEYEQLLADELHKKRKTIRLDNNYEIKARLFRFAAGRGFEPDVINKALNR